MAAGDSSPVLVVEQLQQWEQHLKAKLTDTSCSFTAGRLHQHREAFRAHWEGCSQRPDEVRRLTHVLEQGAQADARAGARCKTRVCLCTYPYAAGQQQHPRFQQKEQQIAAMLTRSGCSPQQVQAVMHSNQPPVLQFSNHHGVQQHCLAVCRRGGDGPRAQAWGSVSGMGPLREVAGVLILPLDVAVSSGGKKRLILDARFLNWWLKYRPFSYQKLQHCLTYLRKGWFQAKADLKAGYHHVLMYPEHRLYLGFQRSGQVYLYNALPFGVAPACELFTTLMQQTYQPFVDRGLPLTFMIDDVHTAAATQRGLMLQLECLLVGMTALGYVFGTPKCELGLVQYLVFLGMGVDSGEGRFTIPADKLQRLQQELMELAGRQQATPRDVAKVLGLVVLVRTALPQGQRRRQGLSKQPVHQTDV